MTELPDVDELTLEQRVRLLSGGDFWHTRPVPEHGVPAVTLTDGPHGIRAQSATSERFDLSHNEPATCFPTAVTLASSWDEELVEEVGRALGTEARALGVAVALGPGMNIKRHPLGGRNFEYLSEDPLVSGRMAAAMVRGIQSRGVGACLKHFAVNNQESHRFVVDAVVDERTLRELYLAGFEHALTARPWAVMAAYNRLNGLHCTDNPRLLSMVLRGQWGFDGLVVSDWGAVEDRAAAVRAGTDLEMPGTAGDSDREVLAAVRSGRLEREHVTDSARRVLELVGRAPRDGSGGFPVERHHALARRAAAEGTVLLTNDGTLPLSRQRTVALIGAFAESPRYQGNGSSLVTPTQLDTALEELRGRGVNPHYARGYEPGDSERNPTLVAEAVEAARRADVAVVLAGLPGAYETEGVDRQDLGLPAQHDDLINAVCAANPRTVVALSNGAPVAMPWVDRPAAILECYLGGQAGGAALVDVLHGDVEPAGRLAESLPVAVSDVAANPFFPGRPHQVEHREGLFVGYRHHTTSGVRPLFPFGHGLGYTTFEWGAATVDRQRLGAEESVTVSLEVTNTGDRGGSEVVQVYVHDRTGVVLRPRRELRGFAKVRLDPGRSTTVEVELGPRAFAYYDVERAEWTVPRGTFDIEVARSSADVVHTLPVELTEGVSTSPEPPTTPPVATDDAAFRQRLGGPVPTPRAVLPFTRESTVAEISSTALGGLFARVLRRATPVGEDALGEGAVTGTLDRVLSEMPLRGLARLSGGRLRGEVVDLLVDALNGRRVSTGVRVLRTAAEAVGGRIVGGIPFRRETRGISRDTH
ncbi:glycoside hydrolase family 3 C-terminal domain-containing protein [Actinopolyspora mortivallis]|uniref:glycoside hydrolase family 3 C-terminal domain-containing protein n=1 Tax=Actinopolyspora mortivallis TaxID=33906 RepID=UPI0012EE83C8|nr:glycoside hydrolase family 3 C-terminal domain-containing protein [Actinopolyspora mortivallis]